MQTRTTARWGLGLIWACGVLGCATAAPTPEKPVPTDEVPPEVQGAPDQYTVAVAQLAQDVGHRTWYHLSKRLRQIEGVEVVKAKTLIEADGPAGTEAAQAFLRRCADVEAVVYGRIDERDGQSTPVLFWTPLRSAEPALLDNFALADLALPEREVEQLGRLFDALVLSSARVYYKDESSQLTRALMEAIETLGQFARSDDFLNSWSSLSRGRLRRIFADILQVHISPQDHQELFEFGVEQYQYAVDDFTGANAPLELGRIQFGLGTALQKLDLVEPSLIGLSDSREAFEAALEQFTRDNGGLICSMKR